jgi:hypothetical protein
MRKLLPILLLAPLAFAQPAAACVSSGTCNSLPGWAQAEFSKSGNDPLSAAASRYKRADAALKRFLSSKPDGYVWSLNPSDDEDRRVLSANRNAAKRAFERETKLELQRDVRGGSDPRCPCKPGDMRRWDA